MASVTLTNAYVALGGTNVSTYVKGVTFTREVEVQDDTAMGMSYRSNLPGLQNWNLQIEFKSDYADNLLDEILNGLIGTVFTVALRAVNTTIGDGNPEWQSYGTITSWQVLGGSVGDLAMSPVTIVPAGGTNAAIVRDVTA
jgi:hypothetical protein